MTSRAEKSADGIQRLNSLMFGWLGYFQLSKIWAKLRTRQLGIDTDMAYAWSRSRMGGWAIAQSPIMGTTVTNARLVGEGIRSGNLAATRFGAFLF